MTALPATTSPAPAKPKPPESPGLWGELSAVLHRRKEVWSLVSRKHRWAFLAAVGVMAVASLTETGIALLLGKFFDEVLKHRGSDTDALFRFAAGYLGLLGGAYILKESLQVVRRYLVQGTASAIEQEMTVRLVSHLLKVDLAALSRDRVGALSGRISRSVEGFVKFLKISFTDFVPAILTAAFALAAGLWAEPRVGLVMAAVIPFAIFITIRQVISQKGIRMDLMRAREAMDGTVVEQLGGMEYIRAANTHQIEAQRIAAAAEERKKKQFSHHMAMSFYDWLKSVNEGLFHLLVISYAIYLAAQNAIDFGKIVTFSFLFMNVMRPLREVHRILDEAYESSMQVGVLLEMLNEPDDQSFQTVTMRQPRLSGDVPLILAEKLTVDYRLPDGRTRRALDGVSLRVEHGETIGVAGPSGSGKSTWLRAVMRLIHPSGGVVMLGGVPADALSREDIGKLIGYVSQIPFVFSGTVTQNIAYAKPEATRAEIENAARLAHIHDEILLMPAGYETPLTERGGNLSGGQRQRIAIARLFLLNPPILILDEGTSALDNISERHVQEAIAAARADRTVIMVAHRLSTLRDTDRILVFEAGKIVEEGRYDDLAARGGLFTRLLESADGAA
jgi:ATP-binding cassette subfamily B protein